LKDLVTIVKPGSVTDGQFGRITSTWTDGATIHANVKWVKGVKALREGQLEAYDTLMVRCRWRSDLKRECRLKIKGRVYQILSLNESFEDNEMQMTVVEVQV